jgi:hypothetical protein
MVADITPTNYQPKQRKTPMNDKEMNCMPWTRHLMTKEDFQGWIASREAVGREINIETCELGKWAASDADAYAGADTTLNEEMRQVGTNRFVRSAESRGWVHEGDLPPAESQGHV